MSKVPNPPDAGGRLAELAAVLAGSLALWATRDDTKPQPEVRQAANTASDAIDAMMRELYIARQRLGGEMRESDDAAMERSASLLARPAAPRVAECGCPVADGAIRHQRETCTDPVTARLQWYADDPAPVTPSAGRRLCAHAGLDGAGMHFLEPGQTCPRAAQAEAGPAGEYW
ncbi:MAG TPA: hypothetical protein VFX25_19110 [Streptosporangiaceae bacterium]|nr:hypothetical protein [Streptosporangiaceae bacterium]